MEYSAAEAEELVDRAIFGQERLESIELTGDAGRLTNVDDLRTLDDEDDNGLSFRLDSMVLESRRSLWRQSEETQWHQPPPPASIGRGGSSTRACKLFACFRPGAGGR